MRRSTVLPAALVTVLLGPLAARAGEPLEAVLPPLEPWEGRSLELAVPPDAPWATPFERDGMARTPSYDETVAWLERLAAAAPQLEMVSLGTSPEGRAIWMVIASREGAATPEALHAAGRPVLLAQAGIHSGEIDGKDAGMMLLRDLTVGGRPGRRRAARPGQPALRADPQRRRPRALVALRAHQPARPGRDGLAHQRPQPQPEPRLRQARHARGAGDGGGHRALAARSLPRPARHRRHRLPVRHHLGLQRPPRLVAGDRRLAGRAADARRQRGARRHGTRARAAVLPHRRATTRPRASSSGPARRASRTATATPGTCRRSWSRTTRSSPIGGACWAPTCCSRAPCAALGEHGSRAAAGNGRRPGARAPTR